MQTKAIFIAVCSFVLGLSPIIAQNVSENKEVRAKVINAVEKLDAAFKLEKSRRTIIEEIFTDFYTGQQNLRNNLQRPASGLANGLTGQSFQSTRKRNEALHADRESRLKRELSEKEYKTWRAKIEPSLHSDRKRK